MLRLQVLLLLLLSGELLGASPPPELRCCDAEDDLDDGQEVSLIQVASVKQTAFRVTSAVAGDSNSSGGSHQKVVTVTAVVTATAVVEAQPVATQGDVQNEPLGFDIWNTSGGYPTAALFHPVGIISNVNQGQVIWASGVSFFSLNAMLVISLIAYPAFLVLALLVIMMMVSMCLVVKPNAQGLQSGSQSGREDTRSLPPVELLDPDDLTDFSKWLYFCWCGFCRTFPCLFVFGIPLVLMVITLQYPQEVWACLTVLTSVLVFSNSIYIVSYGTKGLFWIRRFDQRQAQGQEVQRSVAEVEESSEAPVCSVSHWVILPQYEEDVQVVSMAIRSVVQSAVAKNIGVLLAMEAREDGGREKAEALKAAFKGQLGEIQACFHPANLPNDAPGKASNTAFAFAWLLDHLDLDMNIGDEKGALYRPHIQAQQAADEDVTRRLGYRGRTPTVLTIADADSEFHRLYFEGLGREYLQASPEKRDLHIWQAPVFHIKNYHKQPAPVQVGTIFTGLHDLAILADPFSTKFPYSTYSIPLALARRVGGWDAQWIAEDWHMGIKCFLFTLGQSSVQPLFLPTCNFTPEDDTVLGTLHARWTQAKRHALGFSDLPYYFMMLPLIFGKASSIDQRYSAGQKLRDFWNMAFFGTTFLFRLINVHVILGLLSSYGALTLLIKLLMLIWIPEARHVDLLFLRGRLCSIELAVAAAVCVALVNGLFVCAYETLKSRVDGKPHESMIKHWLLSYLTFVFAGPFFFLGIGLAVLLAAVRVLFSLSFKYDVALKPKMQADPEIAGSDEAGTLPGGNAEELSCKWP